MKIHHESPLTTIGSLSLVRPQAAKKAWKELPSPALSAKALAQSRNGHNG